MRPYRSAPYILATFVAFLLISAQAQAVSTVSNVSFTQRPGTKLVDVTYDLAVTGPNPTVELSVSLDSGATFTLPVNSVTGDVGEGISAGVGKVITWNAEADWNGYISPSVKVKVTAWEPAGSEMAWIRGGIYQRGDNLDGEVAAPVQSIYVSTFFAGKMEVSKAQWDTVRTWGLANGYTDLPTGAGKAADHPVQSVSWYAVVKWCNAASEMEGLMPAYYTNDSQTFIYETGNVDVTNAQVNWSADGYRLPTEAEWEKAARGGVTGQRFPWGNTITHAEANYLSSASWAYDVSSTRSSHPAFVTGGTPFTNPVAGFAANSFGLKNTVGNVMEWCWDWSGSTVAEPDPKGTATGTGRLRRGGSWDSVAYFCRSAARGSSSPGASLSNTGIRVVRTTQTSALLSGVGALDTTGGPPVLTSVAITSSNASSTFAKAGDTITLHFTASKVIHPPIVTLMGVVPTVVNVSGNQWSASTVVAAGSPEGPVQFSITATNLDDETAEPVVATTNGSMVTVDNIAPGFTLVRIASNHTNTARAKDGYTVTLTLTSNESIQSPTVTLMGVAATVSNTGGNNWRASAVVIPSIPEGIATFSIVATDLAGNTAAPVTSITTGVSVSVDRSAPTFPSVTIASDQSNPSRGKVGSVITLNFSTNESVTTPVVTLLGLARTATLISANSWRATATVAADANEGQVPFSITVTDLPGVTAHVSTTTNGSEVVVDRTPPVVSSVSIASNNPNPARAKQGNTVTLSFTASEAISNPTVFLMGVAYTATNPSGNNWVATAPVGSNTAEGLVGFSIGVTDVFGNAASNVTSTTDGSSVLVDKTTPLTHSVYIVCDNPVSPRANVGSWVTVGFTANEALLMPSVTIFGASAQVSNPSGNSWIAKAVVGSGTPEGVVAFSINASDLTGNAIPVITTTTNSTAVTVDRTTLQMPTVSIVSSNASPALAKAADVVTLSFTASESVQPPSVTLLGAAATVANLSGNTWTATATVSGGSPQGVATFSIDARDLAGNALLVSATSDGSMVTVDTMGPLFNPVSIMGSGSNPSRARVGEVVTVTFTASEVLFNPSVTLLGAVATLSNPSGNQWTATTTVGAGTAEGLATFSISASDATGNVTSAVTSSTDGSTLLVDNIPPAFTSIGIASNNANATRAKDGDTVTLSFTTNESISAPSVTLLGGTSSVVNTGGNHWSASALISPSIPEGPAAFSISIADLAGNAAATATSTLDASSVMVDKVTMAPTLTTPASGGGAKNPITVAYTLPEAAKPGSLKLSFGSSHLILATSFGTTGAHSFTFNPASPALSSGSAITSGAAVPDGNYTVTLSYQDAAGNAEAASAAATNFLVDTTAPTLTLPANIVAETNGSTSVVNFSVSATDAGDPAPVVVATPASGSAFPIGVTMVNVTATDAVGNSRQSSFEVNVIRVGPEIVVWVPGRPALIDGVSTVALAVAAPGSSSAQTFNILNTGNFDLTGLSTTIDGPDAADFSVSTAPVAPVTPGGSTVFTVTFAPTTAGSKSAVLHLHSNDDDEASFDINLTARTHEVRFQYADFSYQEANVTIRVPVTLSSAFGSAFTVPFTMGGTADAKVSASPLKFTASQTTAFINITLSEDKLPERDDPLILILGTPSTAGVTVVVPSDFTLTILEDDVRPSFAPRLSSQIVAVGDEVSFSSDVTGSDPLTLKWRQGSKVLLGETTNTLLISAVTLSSAGAYTLSATNETGPEASTAELAVVDRSDTIVRANAGTSAKLSVAAKGNLLSYRWRDVNGDLPLTGTKFAGAGTATLTVKQVTGSDAGHYICRITAPGGMLDSGDFHLQVPSQVTRPDPLSLPDVVIHNPFSYQITFDTDPTRAPTKFVCSGLPKGLSCNPVTGLISGIPTEIGDFTVVAMVSNDSSPATTVQDSFQVFRFPEDAVGSYVGLIGRSLNANGNLGGRIDLTTTHSGGFTGMLRLGATAIKLKGALATDPEIFQPGVTLTLPRRAGQAPVVLVLKIDPFNNSLAGSVYQQGDSGADNLSGWRNVWSTSPVQLGAHSFKIDPDTTGPQGYGFGTIAVTNRGVTTVKGKSADGGVILSNGLLGRLGEVLVYAPMHGNKASLLGVLDMDPDSNHSITGSLNWQKLAQTKAREYEPFGPVSVAVTGGRYVVESPVLGLTDLGVDNAELLFSDAGVPSLTNPNVAVYINITNKLKLSATNPGSVKMLSFNAGTGAFTGQFTLRDAPAAPRTVKFQGWLVPTESRGYGYFLLPQLANPPSTTAGTSPILSGKVVLE